MLTRFTTSILAVSGLVLLTCDTISTFPQEVRSLDQRQSFFLIIFDSDNVYLEVTSIASPVIIACSDVGEKGEVVASEGFIRLATIFWAFSVNVRIPVHFLRETLLIAWQIESTPSVSLPAST